MSILKVMDTLAATLLIPVYMPNAAKEKVLSSGAWAAFLW
jgi:hypothetical protein